MADDLRKRRERRRKNSNKDRQKNNKGISQIRILATVICFIVLGCGLYVAAYLYLPNYETESIYDFFQDFEEGQINIVLGGETVKREIDPLEKQTVIHYPVEKEGVIYIPVDFVKAYLDQYIFWDAPLNKLTITTENKVIRMNTEDLNYRVNNEPMRLNLPVYNIDGQAYLPASLLEELYHISVAYDAQYKIVTIDKNTEGRTNAPMIKRSVLRFEPNIKSPIEKKLEIGEPVVIFEKSEGFTKVRTTEGLIGYVPTKNLGEEEYIAPIVIEETSPSIANPIDGKIVMLWDQVFKVESNSTESRRTKPPGVNVLSPTWFSFESDSTSTEIINIADKDYVDFAHENGMQVWPLIFDDADSEISHRVLNNTDTREHVIKQLLAFISLYELDGINIDFERVKPDDAENFLQFLRELKPLMLQQNAVLSVDMFVPSAWSAYYNRTEVGKVVDYVCVMTYDEHYGGSETAGPVASLGFVDKGIADTIDEVSKEKVIMGVPFYVRVWREVEDDEGISLTIRNYAMDEAYKIFKRKGVEFTWLEDIGSYYGEYKETEEGLEVTYKVWMEDERSIEEKMKIFQAYDIGGIACWKRGLNNDQVWDVIGNGVNP